ncbi:MAG: ROK family glucokinase [Thermicanus sp.]|nr:ROK family glucokinase [Thermicanus sp.]
MRVEDAPNEKWLGGASLERSSKGETMKEAIMMKAAIAVDVGGTYLKLGLIHEEGRILTSLSIPTPVGEGADEILHKISDGVKQIAASSSAEGVEILGVGLGIPGYVLKDRGLVTQAVNLHWRDYPAKEKLQRLIPYPVFMDNDANLAALGEMWKGAGVGAKEMIMVTLGTGVGGGILIHGEIVSGVNGIGGEIGHMPVRLDGERCNCGRFGCLETESSATAMRRKAVEALQQGRESLLRKVYEERGRVTPRDMAEAASVGDSLALEIFDSAAYSLAFALGALINSLNPERILIGGGVSAAGELLMNPLRKHLERFALPEALEVLTLEIAKLGNDAGMIGGGYLVFQSVKSLS